MYVRRDYRRPMFARRRRFGFSWLLLVLIGVTALLLVLRFQSQELEARLTAMLGGTLPTAAPTQLPAQYAATGADLFRAGDLDGAREALTRAVQQRPNDIAYLYELGKVLIELERTDEAVEMADRAIAVNPQDVRGHALRANALKWDAPDAALQDALRGIEIDPTFAPLHAAMAVAYNNIQRYTQALEAGKKAIELDPMDADTYRAYAWPLILVGRYEEAITMLEKSIALAPNLTGPYFQLAFEYKNRAKDPAMAVAIYQYIIDNMNVSPADEAKAYLRICETYAGVENARFDVAEPYCRQAMQIQPDYGSAYRELGRMQYLRRNYEGSIESFQTCATLQEGLPRKDIECWAFRGLAHFWMAQCDDAWTVLNQALELGKAQGEAESVMQNINDGIYNVTQLCPDYANVPTPTPQPPTPIPPTPIGGV